MEDIQRTSPAPSPEWRVVVLTGVAGSGKTTVGQALAERLGWRFCDADDLHSSESIERIRSGRPLDDEIRQPWLLRVREVIADALRTDRPAVVACSALKARYRRTLSEGLRGVRFVFLAADPALLRQRLRHRVGHFAGADLLASQLEALEPPSEALTLDAALTVDELVVIICREIAAPAEDGR